MFSRKGHFSHHRDPRVTVLSDTLPKWHILIFKIPWKTHTSAPASKSFDLFATEMSFLYQASTTALIIILPLAAGYLLRDVKAGALGTSSQKDVEDAKKQLEALKKSEEHLKVREAALDAKEKSLERRESELAESEKKMKALDAREAEPGKHEAAHEKEKSLLERENNLQERESSTLAIAPESKDEKDAAVEKEDEADGKEEVPKGDSEKEKRIRMIKEELEKVVKQVEEEELAGEEMEKEAVEALEKAALVVAFRKKYYDVMKDELIYFPSVSKTIVSYALMEEAEKYYYEEEDEFPMDYSVALRSVVTMNMSEDDDDVDEEYMAKLALDVEI